MRRFRFAFLCLVIPLSAFAQANGKLQIHYMDVGQGEGAVLISPLGEIVLFDDGVVNQCAAPIAYLQSLGITHIDYHVASHYHSDHIGCAPQVLQMFPLIKAAYDRGGSYETSVFTNYVNAIGAKRITAVKGQSITLDAGSAHPVTITFVALNGNGAATSDESDLSLVAVVHFGAFDAEFGGDLGGANTGVADADPYVPVTPPACAYSVSPTSMSAGSGAGGATVFITTTSGCFWTASSNASWIAIRFGASGPGSGTVALGFGPNTGSDRSGTVTIAGQTVTINQSGVVTNACAPATASCGTATAHCNDGSLSCSQNRSGTCSSQGGVGCWICPGTLCSGLSATQPQFLPFSPARTLDSYADLESSVAGLVGQIEVYSVHHHGSATASKATWLATTTPKVAIISAGISNPYGHPTLDALTRLHHVGAKTYWTTPGKGAAPTPGADVVSNSAAIVVQAAPGSTSFTVTTNSTTDTYNDWGVNSLAAGPPFGSFDTPTDGASVAGEVGVTGWALDDSGVLGIDIYRSPVAGDPTSPNGLVFVGTATQVPGARPDVAGLYPTYPGNNSAGWGYMLLSNMLPNQGNGTFTIYAYVRTVDGANALIGSKRIVGANGTSKKPFGTIDTPTQGQTVSGTLVNFGWALTPQPDRIPVDGSTITVFIDNVPVGHPAYGQPRADIQALFPGYANTNTAVGAFIIDTTTMTNGLHSIAWVVFDNVGNSNGIGSRFFTVANTASPVCVAPGPVGFSAPSAYTPPSVSACSVSDVASLQHCVSQARLGTTSAIRIDSMLSCTLPGDCQLDLTGLAGPLTVYGQNGGGFKRSNSYTYTIVDVSGSANITIANLLFDEDETVACDAVANPPPECQSTLRAFNATNITIDDVIILHSKRMAIEVSGSNDVTIKNSDVEDSGVFGIFSGLSNTSNLIIQNNRFVNIWSNAVFVELVSSASVKANTFDHNHRKAIFSDCGGPCPGGQLDLLSSGNLTLEGNLIQNGFIDVNTTKNDTVGIEINAGLHDVMIRGNMITTNKGGGITVNDGVTVQNVVVTGNSFVDNKLAFYNFGVGGVQESDDCVSGSLFGSSLESNRPFQGRLLWTVTRSGASSGPNEAFARKMTRQVSVLGAENVGGGAGSVFRTSAAAPPTWFLATPRSCALSVKVQPTK